MYLGRTAYICRKSLSLHYAPSYATPKAISNSKTKSGRRARNFSGQDKIVETSVSSSRRRSCAATRSTMCCCTAPGLGKTTLANIISNEMGAQLRLTSGPVLDKPGDLAGCF